MQIKLRLEKQQSHWDEQDNRQDNIHLIAHIQYSSDYLKLDGPNKVLVF